MNFQEKKIIFQGKCCKRNNENFIPKKLTPYTQTIYPYIYQPADILISQLKDAIPRK